MEGPAARVLFLGRGGGGAGGRSRGAREARHLADDDGPGLEETPSLWTCSEDGQGGDTTDSLPPSWDAEVSDAASVDIEEREPPERAGREREG